MILATNGAPGAAASSQSPRCSDHAEGPLSLCLLSAAERPAGASEPPGDPDLRAAMSSAVSEPAPVSAQVVAVPLAKVRFLQAMAEDGPRARHCRTDGFPAQQVVQQTLC